MRITPIVAATLALLSGCRTPTPLATTETYGAAGLWALLRSRPPEWSSAGTMRFDRAALLVAADAYSEHPEWALPGARESVARLSTALTRHCAVSPRAVTTLAGAAVHRDAVVTALGKAADQISGPTGVLFVAYAGHGFVDADGDPLLFGHFTRARDGGGFEGGIARRDLVGAVAAARDRAASRGVVLHVILVVDACRVAVASPPPKATLREAPLWELWGTRAGTYARASDGERPFPFTAALCDAMRVLAATSATVDLRRLAEEARARTLAATAGNQEPELLAPRLGAEPPSAVVSTALVFRVGVTDAVSSARVDTFSVRVGTRTFVSTAEGEAVVQAWPGRQTIAIEAGGYLSRVDEIEVASDRAGAVLQAEVYPTLVLVSGRVSPPAVVAIRAVGGYTPPRANYHLTQSITGRDGAFQLRLPSLADGVTLEFVVDGRVVQTVELPRSTEDVCVSPGLPAVPRVDLEVPLVTDGAELADSGVAALGQPTAVPRGRDVMAQAELDRVFELIRARQYVMARDALAATDVDSGDEDLRRSWLAWLELQAARAEPIEQALARLAELRANGAAEAQWTALAETALRRLVDARDWQGVIDLCARQAQAPQSTSASWHDLERRVLPTALEQVLRAGLVTGVQEGDWTAADRALEWLRDATHLWVLHERPEIATLQREVERERITPACRKTFERAEIALAEGRLEDACAMFESARDGANAHYRQRIDERLQQLEVTLFETAMRLGTEHELAGRRGEALAAYAKAYARNPRASESVRRVLHAGKEGDVDFTRLYEGILAHVLERARSEHKGDAWAELSRLFASDARARQALRQELIAPWADVLDDECGPSGLPRVVRDRHSGILMRLVEPGTFMMGAPASDDLATAVERPRHRVQLTQPFYMGETEVTWEVWRQFAAETGAGDDAKAVSNRHPVAGVSWRDAAAFCAYYGLRLPTEAEWEYVARAGNGEVYRRFPWGDDVAGAEGNLRGLDEGTREADVFPVRDGHVGTAPVASFAANAWGFFDLIGNVREWCVDTFDAAAYRGRADGARDPVTTAKGDSVVTRGGSFQDGPRTSGVATRLEVSRDAHLPWAGLRVARSAW